MLLQKIKKECRRFIGKSNLIKGYNYFLKSYSQEGEDIVLKSLMDSYYKGQNDKSEKFYVDIGAHHPYLHSVTQHFYEKGWRGINIDPFPGTKKRFDKERPGDINIEAGISSKTDKLTFYIFNIPQLNTFSKEQAEKRLEDPRFKIVEERVIDVFKLEDILDKYLGKDKKINLLNIDAEGLDFEILKSNNWDKYKPDFIVVEELTRDIEKILKSELYEYLKFLGYALEAKTGRSLIFWLNKNLYY